MDDALQCALEWLLSAQLPDGSWPDFMVWAAEGNEWPTGYISALLGNLPVPLGSPWNFMLARARAFVRGSCRLAGGWGFSSSTPVDSDSTAWCLLALLTSKEAEAEDFSAELGELREHQHAETGGFSTYRRQNAGPFPANSGYYAPSPCVTASVLLALHESASTADLPLIRRGIEYLSATQNDNGSWDSPWWEGGIYSTAIVARLFAKLKCKLQTLPATRAWLEGIQDQNGAWLDERFKQPDAFATSLAIRALLDLDVPASAPSVKRGRAWLLETQHSDGSWDSRPSMRIPSPHQPWERTKPYDGVIVAGHRRNFTTATVIATLARFAPGRRTRLTR